MGKAKRVLTAVVAFALGAVACLGVCTSGYRDWSSLKKTVNKVEESYNGFMANVKESQGIELMVASASESGGVATVSESGTTYTIRATVTGEGYFSNHLGWSIDWLNASSDWAKGKSVSSYVTLDVAEDLQSVNVTNSTPFGEPIVVKASSLEVSTISATCQLDYVKRVTDIQFFSYDTPNGLCNSTSFVVIEEEELVSEYYTDMAFSVLYSVGTVYPAISVDSISLREKSGALYDELSYLFPEIGFYYFEPEMLIEDYYLGGEGNESFYVSTGLLLGSFGLPSAEYNSEANLVHNAFIDLANDDNISFDGVMVYSFDYNGIDFGTGRVSLPSNTICSEAMTARGNVKGVTLGDDNLAF